MRRHAKGFTLIELMIVVVIIAILAALAYPSYIEHIHKSRRADAIQAIGQVQLQLERWRAENPCYGPSGGTCPTFTASGTYPTAAGLASLSPYYDVNITAATPTAYIITAAPRTGTGQAGDRCVNYSFAYAAGVLTKSANNIPNNASCSLQ